MKLRVTGVSATATAQFTDTIRWDAPYDPTETDMRKFRDLYMKLPAERRAVIDAKVQGELARRNNVPLTDNPYFGGDKRLMEAWRDAWGETDQILIGEQILEREKATPPQQGGGEPRYCHHCDNWHSGPHEDHPKPGAQQVVEGEPTSCKICQNEVPTICDGCSYTAKHAAIQESESRNAGLQGELTDARIETERMRMASYEQVLRADAAEQQVERLRKALVNAYEDAVTVALEQRCERSTPWDKACLTIAAVIRERGAALAAPPEDDQGEIVNYDSCLSEANQNFEDAAPASEKEG